MFIIAGKIMTPSRCSKCQGTDINVKEFRYEDGQVISADVECLTCGNSTDSLPDPDPWCLRFVGKKVSQS